MTRRARRVLIVVALLAVALVVYTLVSLYIAARA